MSHRCHPLVVPDLIFLSSFLSLFRIKETGELSIASLQSLNSSDAHVVAIATDSGLPPRQTSVPITIHFPNEVVSAAKTLLSGGENFLMITVFSSLLILLLLIIIALGVYIHKGLVFIGLKRRLLRKRVCE